MLKWVWLISLLENHSLGIKTGCLLLSSTLNMVGRPYRWQGPALNLIILWLWRFCGLRASVWVKFFSRVFTDIIRGITWLTADNNLWQCLRVNWLKGSSIYMDDQIKACALVEEAQAQNPATHLHLLKQALIRCGSQCCPAFRIKQVWSQCS